MNVQVMSCGEVTPAEVGKWRAQWVCNQGGIFENLL